MTTKKILLTAVFVFLLAISSAYAEITRGPYLQPTEDMETSVGVAWRTANGGVSTIYYGINDVNENSVQVEAVEATEPTATGGSEYVTVYKYYIKLTGLTPGATYRYRIEGDGDVEPEPGQGSHNSDYYEFKTSPPDGKFKVLVGSDWQLGLPEYHSRFLPIYQDMLAFDPDVVLITGDIVELGNHLEYYEDLFNTCRRLFATAVFVPVAGNHEFSYDPGLEIYKTQYYLPENGPEKSKEEIYSIDYGNVHFVILQSDLVPHYPWPFDWLDVDLSAAKSRGVNFIFSGEHFPIYLDIIADRELSLHGGSKMTLTQLYDKYDVDIEFVGHRHAHQRTYPILNNPFDKMQWGIITTPEKEYYNANIKGTIYQQIRSTNYEKSGAYNDLHFVPPLAVSAGVSTLGYSEITVNRKIAAVESYKYTYDNSGTISSSRTLEDRYVIDNSDTSELPIPVISNVRVTELSAYRAVIEYQTDIPSRGQVEFGTSSGNYTYVDMREDQNQVFKTSHKLTPQCLTPGTTYYFSVKAWRAGKEAISGEYGFTTSSQAQPGELVAEFDFGPIMFAPYGARVSPVSNPDYIGSWQGFDNRTRHGWYTKKQRPYPWTHLGVGAYAKGFPIDATGTYAVGYGDYQPTWATELPNGEYDMEVTVGNYYSAPTDPGIRIVFQDAPLNLEEPESVNYKTLCTLDAPKPADTWNTLWIWPIGALVENGYLHIEPYGPINRLRIYAKGALTPDTSPPEAEAGPNQTVEAGTEVSFDGSGSTDASAIVYYHWDFDNSDGIQVDAIGSTVKHRYDKIGTYVVTLSCSDGIVQNGEGTDTLTVTVNPDSIPPATQAMPKGRTYSGSITVSLLSDELATIYYSTDGTDPVIGASNTKSGPSPLGGITLTSTTTLKFFAVDPTGNKEEVNTETYTIRATPLHTYYVDPNASSGGNGSSQSPFKTIAEGLNVAQVGDAIILRDGTYSYAEAVSTVRGGNATDGPITIKAEHRHGAILTRKGDILNIVHPYVTVEGLALDHQFSRSGRVLWVRTGGDNFYLKDTIARNSAVHIVNLVNSGDYLEDVTIEGCFIHGALLFNIDANGRIQRDAGDAHGISTEGVRNLLISNTEVRDVSGDSLQPEYEGWDNILLSNVRFWNRPIPHDVAQALADAEGDQRFLQLEGKYPGENAIDTKEDWPPAPRGRITMADSTFSGWRSDFIGTCAALNLKHNITAVVERCTLYDNEYAFRLRGQGSYPSAHVTVKNCVVYDNDVHVRPEDKIENLHIYNNTFGPATVTALEQAPSDSGIGDDFRALNNLFIESSLPPEMTDPSNLELDVTNVVDAPNRDYHLTGRSRAIDAGVEILEVVTDKDKNARPQGLAYDIGAYEYTGGPSLPGDVNGDHKVDLTDLVIVARAFGSHTGDPSWDARADIAEPRGEITLPDLVVVARNFGRTA